MPFDIPNDADETYEGQAVFSSTDLDAIVAAIAGDAAVVAGCEVTANGTGTLSVAAGTYQINGALVTTAGGNVAPAANASGLPRHDVVVANNVGTPSIVAGTAAARPVLPAIPANSVLLAAVWVEPGATTFTAAEVWSRVLRNPRHGHRVNSGGTTHYRRRTNLVAGNGIALSLQDDPTNEEADVTISAPASGSGFSFAQATDPGGSAVAGQTWLETDRGWPWYRDSLGRWLPLTSSGVYNPLWFGAIGDGTTDDTQAIKDAVAAAKAASNTRESKVLFTGHDKVYKISDTILVPSGSWIEGESISGAQGPYIRTDPAMDITKHAFATESIDRSRIYFIGLHVEDMRTNTARTGNGFHINDATNSSWVVRCLVSKFYKNVFIGGDLAGQEADCVLVRDTWILHPVLYGIHIQRLNNRALLQNLMVDTWNAAESPQAAIRIQASGGGSSGVSVETVKHENRIDGCHGVWVSDGGEHSISNYTMRGQTNNPTSDVVRVSNGTTALTLTLRGINSANTTAAYGDTWTTSGNLFNLVSGSIGTFAIPTATYRAIAHLVLSPPGGFGGVWVNGVNVRSGSGAPTYTAPKGSFYLRTDGSGTTSRAYINTDGATGWTHFVTGA